ncbi:MAG TPA: hypothetical protein VLC09_17330, partial [Polyangiaceae bacterium]|nr:hypothetical protein [Polyangiaceae bacterium]
MRRSGGARWCVAALSAMVVGSYAGSAYAGNLDAFYLSGEASMQAGAISADSRGGGAVWYNPAGLAGLDGLRLDVSVNGYAIRFGGAADFDAPPGADVKRLTGLDINVVPTALTITKNFGSVGFGFGVFVPSQATNILRTQVKLNSDAAGGGLFQFSYDTYRRYQEYHIGPALGFRVSDDLQVGASFLINYRSLVEMADTALIYSVADGGSASTASHQLLDSIQAGAEFVIGAQWKFAKNWRWGGVVRTPAVRLYQLVQTLHTDVMDQGLGQSSMSANEVSAIESTVLTPFRFHT